MEYLDLLCKIYGKLWNRNKLPVWFLSPFRKVVREFANWILPMKLKKDIKLCDCDLNNDIIVSLTSFPARINEVWKVIECLKRQTVLPEKILLWLSKEQFPTDESVPPNLLDLQDNLFQIRFVDGDIRSYKKFYYALKEYPEKTLITCDDDQFYDPNLVKRLLDNSKRHPGCIISNKTLKIVFNEEGELMPYTKWEIRRQPGLNADNLQIGVGGVLYPPHCLDEMVLREDLFLSLSPLADDIWLNVMARLSHTPVVQASPIVLTLPIKLDMSTSLQKVNIGQNMNDKQILQIRRYLQMHGKEDVYSSSYHVL